MPAHWPASYHKSKDVTASLVITQKIKTLLTYVSVLEVGRLSDNIVDMLNIITV